MNKFKWIGIVIALVVLAVFSSCSDSSSGYSQYNPNDKYYSNNDYNGDGNLSDKEFQGAVGDWMDDHGY